MIRNFQEVCQLRKQILTVLIYHVTKSTYYESLSVTQDKRYNELHVYQERIIDSYSILPESAVTKPNQ